MKRVIMVAMVVVAAAVQSLADGKMFWREEIPPDVPYQRALILFEDGTETLILQSSYAVPEGSEGSKLGWVVPVPAVPEVASMPGVIAYEVFSLVSWASIPQVFHVRGIIWGFSCLTLLGLVLGVLLSFILSFVVSRSRGFMLYRRRWAWIAIMGLSVVIVAGPAFFTGSRGVSSSVDVLAEHQVGIYDVSVIRSDTAGDLVDWLNAHEFKCGEQDTAVFESYLSRGWCFVVAVINPSRVGEESRMVSEGLADPLILRFPHPQPVYPLALTGTGGFDTEILIYLASTTKMACDDRLRLRYAGDVDTKYVWARVFSCLAAWTDPAGFFDPDAMKTSYLCKFRDRLTPAQMREDIVFRKAEDAEPYRERIVRW